MHTLTLELHFDPNIPSWLFTVYDNLHVKNSLMRCVVASMQHGHMQSNYDVKIQDLEHSIEDKDERIKELLHHLKQQGETTIVEPVPRPPGVARRTASIGVQTSHSGPVQADALQRSVASQEVPAKNESLSSEDVVSSSI